MAPAKPFPSIAPAIDPPRATGNRRAGAACRRPGLTGRRRHDVTAVCRAAARPRRRRGSCSQRYLGRGSQRAGGVSRGLRGAAQFRNQGGTVILITNAPRPADSVQRQLRKLGVADDTYDAIVSSGDLTRHFVADHPGQQDVLARSRSATVRSTAASIRCSLRWSRPTTSSAPACSTTKPNRRKTIAR